MCPPSSSLGSFSFLTCTSSARTLVFSDFYHVSATPASSLSCLNSVISNFRSYGWSYQTLIKMLGRGVHVVAHVERIRAMQLHRSAICAIWGCGCEERPMTRCKVDAATPWTSFDDDEGILIAVPSLKNMTTSPLASTMSSTSVPELLFAVQKPEEFRYSPHQHLLRQ